MILPVIVNCVRIREKGQSMARHISGPLYLLRHGAIGRLVFFLKSRPDDHRLWMLHWGLFRMGTAQCAVDHP